MGNVPRNLPSEVNRCTRWLRNSAVYTSSFLPTATPTQAANSPSFSPCCPHSSRNRGGGGVSSPCAPLIPKNNDRPAKPAPARKRLRDNFTPACQLCKSPVV